MTLLHDAVDSKKLDVRVVERNIQRGFVKPEEHTKFVSGLPDDTENAEYVNVETLASEGKETSSH
jgi:hypothetical protein